MRRKDTPTRGALVTGSASGLGRALAVRLARDGWRIVLADVNDQDNRGTLQRVAAAGGDGQIAHLDVSEANSWLTLIEKIRKNWGHLDLLVNNAGVTSSGEVGTHSLEDWRWILKTNLHGAIYGCQTVLPWMKKNPRGAHLVNIASVAAVMCSPQMAAYNVTKAGVLALSETLYAELQPTRVGITVVCPGFFETNILTKSRYRNAAMYEHAAEEMRTSRLSAEKIADRIMLAMRRKELYLFLPRNSRYQWWCKRLLPAYYLRKISQGFHNLFDDERSDMR